MAQQSPVEVKIGGSTRPYKVRFRGSSSYPGAITRTCKQMRSESLSLFYSCNTFYIRFYDIFYDIPISFGDSSIRNAIIRRVQCLSTILTEKELWKLPITIDLGVTDTLATESCTKHEAELRLSFFSISIMMKKRFGVDCLVRVQLSYFTWFIRTQKVDLILDYANLADSVTTNARILEGVAGAVVVAAGDLLPDAPLMLLAWSRLVRSWNDTNQDMAEAKLVSAGILNQ